MIVEVMYAIEVIAIKMPEKNSTRGLTVFRVAILSFHFISPVHILSGAEEETGIMK